MFKNENVESKQANHTNEIYQLQKFTQSNVLRVTVRIEI